VVADAMATPVVCRRRAGMAVAFDLGDGPRRLADASFAFGQVPIG
jgi:hypothetical protein